MPSWQQFKSLSTSGCPKLFYRFSHKKDSFELLLTDLVGLWSCQQTRDQTIENATANHCSIDPSESDAQYEVLLTKLEQSLARGQNHLGVETKGQNYLTLRTRLDLPAPLKPLIWIFDLTPQAASEMAECILQPCLQELSVSSQQIDALLQTIKDKDHVITKLLDRISNTAIDLTLIFPSITGRVARRGDVTVDEAKKYVAGMAKFDQGVWLKEYQNVEETEPNNTSPLKVLLESDRKCTVHTRAEHESWVSRLPDLEHIIESSPHKRKPLPAFLRSNTSRGDTSQTSEAAFERQPTPPERRSKKRSLEDDKSAQTSPDKKAKIRLGALKSTKSTRSRHEKAVSSSSQSESSRSNSPSPSSRRKTEPVLARSPTESDSSDHDLTDVSHPRSQVTRHKKPTVVSQKDDRETVSEQVQSSQSPRKLGRLRGKRSSSPPSAPIPSPRPGRKLSHRLNAKHSHNSELASQRGAAPDTDDDSDTELAEQAVSTSHSNPSTPSRRLGRLSQRNTDSGGKSSTEKQRARRIETDRRESSAARSGSTVSDRVSPAKLKSTHSTKARAQPQANTRKQTAVGDQADDGDSTETATDSAHSPSPSPKPKSLSNRQRTEHTNTSDVESTEGHVTKSSGTKTRGNRPPPPEETAEERADRRRQELQKVLHSESRTKGTGSAAASMTAGGAVTKKKPRRF